MTAGRIVRKAITIGFACWSAIVLSSCSEDEFRDPSVETMRLTVGAQVVNVSRDGTCDGCPLVLSDGATVTSQWLTASGQPDPIVVQSQFRLGINIPIGNPVQLTYSLSPTNNLVATFSATGTTSTPFNLTFWLRRIEAGTDNFPPTTVPTIVQ